MFKFARQYWITILIGAATIIGWQLMTTKASFLNPVIFPDFGEIFGVFTRSGEELLQGFVSSMKLLVPAYVASVVLGISGGIFFGLNNTVRKILMPYVHMLSPLPPTLFIPYAIALLPSFQSASIFLIFLGSFWPIFLGAIQGVLIIEKQYLDNAKTLGLKGYDFLFKVIVPAASPYILSGAGTSLTLSFFILTMAEMFGAESGMGYFIQYYSDFAQYDYVIAGMIYNSAVILIALLLFEQLKKRILFWTNLKTDSD
ncbi:ABC transporter permease [Schinkia azotoformans]|uniref:ABC transporter permease n=1 Tax=Schinkia azotoformans TaxID=1454 RepID=UPI002DB899FF|nr:ABC transporter permease [Schinkia azotoformans]MEC1719430.1 ABC transporter permease [Schinkia azotoformans]MED4353428.1 ABC transporter permease [Schinkia azotoformans]MED4415568.1 ABC transporter permease [Schinkia azotoformans]